MTTTTTHTRTPTAEGPPLTAGQRRAFTGAMVLLPVVFFLLLEGGLRVAGFGDAYPLFVPAEGRPGYQYQSRDVARRYFAREQNVPGSLIDFFRAEKAPGAYRIVVQGGSSAAGFPFYHGAAFSRMLAQRLQQTFPEREIEVINTSMAAVNTFTLLDLVDEILAQQPDAVLVYAGHNEYYGALGVGSSERFGGGALTRLYLKVDHWRTVQALRALLSRAAGWVAGQGRGEAPSSTLMERMVGEQSIPFGSPLYEAGLAQYRDNVRTLLGRYAAAGVPVFIGTLAANQRDHAPFLGRPDPENPTWAKHYDAAAAAVAQGRHEAALAAYDDAITADPLAAAAYFGKAQVLEAQSRMEEARDAYTAASDRDRLRFRAPSAVNAILREEAARHSATVVEVEAALAGGDGLVGADVMTEHLHPNVDGYFLLADAYYRRLLEAQALGAGARPVPAGAARADLLVTPLDTLTGHYRLRQLRAAWPFQPPGVVDQALRTIVPEGPVEALAYDLFRDRTTWAAAVERLAVMQQEAGDAEGAVRTLRALAQAYPFLAEPLVEAGNVALRAGRLGAAFALFREADRRQESTETQRMIGSLLLQRGDTKAALPYLERAVVLGPRNEPALYNLSGAYARAGRYADARATAERLLLVAPNHAAGRALLASLPPSP